MAFEKVRKWADNIRNLFRPQIVINIPDCARNNPLLTTVRDVNPNRDFVNLIRRTVKLIEELGETAEALLNYTSAANAKGKTVEDIREEMVDCLVVALDMCLTPLPGDENITYEELEDKILKMFYLKIAKWEKSRKNQTAATLQTPDSAV